MKIVTLLENETHTPELKAEHGLSVYIETGQHKILYDTGKSDLFIQNAKQLNINLKEVDTVIISHGHYDHLGGLIQFLMLNSKAKVYLKKEIFDYKYYSIRNEAKKNIGYLTELKEYEDRFVYVEDELYETSDFFIIRDISLKYPIPKGNKMLFKEKDEVLVNDDFKHELVFGLITKIGLWVFCGCAHNGILNTVATVKQHFKNRKIQAVSGGFHLIDENKFVETESEDETREIATSLLNLAPEATFFTGHCTGKNAYANLEGVLKDKLHRIHTGSVLN